MLLNDNVKAREENPDGTYSRVPAGEPEEDAQEEFYQLAYEKAGN